MKDGATRSEVMDGRRAFRGERVLCCVLYGQFDRPFTNAIELFLAVECLHSMRRSKGLYIFGRAEDQAEEELREGTSSRNQPATVS